MCTGKIEKVWIQNEPIVAYKVQTDMFWGSSLAGLKRVGGWHEAKLRVITQGGGPGLLRLDREQWGNSRTKSVGEYLEGVDNLGFVRTWDGHSGETEVGNVHLSGWHAYKAIGTAFSECWAMAEVDMVFKVELRGLMQASDEGELMASEMRVIEEVFQ